MHRPPFTLRHGIALALALPACVVAATPAAAPGLDIWEFVVDGNTVLDDAAISEAVAPFMGPRRTADDVDKARAALESAYRERGYRTVAVSIPRQSAQDGIVQLLVTEGRVGLLEVRGSRYHSLDRIREAAPSLAEGKVPDFDEVQQDLVALNRQPDRRVTPALAAGKRPGTVDVDLVVEDELPLHGSLELNNRYSLDTSELRASASLSWGNLWQRGHSLSLSYQVAPEDPDDAKVLFASYLARFDDSPWNLLATAVDSDSDVSTVGGVNVLGSGQIYGLYAIRELPGGEGFYPSLSLGAGYKNFDTAAVVGAGTILTPVQYFPFTAAWSGLWQDETAQTQADLSLNFANPQFGSNTRTISEKNRFGARGQMFYLRGALAHRRDFANGLQAFGRIGAQLTDQPLISNEQYSAGGMDTARGYLEAEALGDYGVTATLELRSPPLGEAWKPGGSELLGDTRVFAFVDAAELRLQGPFPDDSTPRSESLLSAGAGVNLRFHDHLNGVLDWARVLEDGPSTDEGSDRVLFRVWTSF